MSDTQSDANATEPQTAESTLASFSAGLRTAETLIHLKDWDAALGVLSRLQAEYMDAVKVFDLMGDVLLRQGNTKEGIRFKTLHEVLKGTFRTVEEETSLTDLGLGERAARGAGEGPGAASDRWAGEASEYFPLTESAAKECMRQGHFDRAVIVLTNLLREKPGDKTLEAALAEAREKQRGKKLLRIFQQWLENIEQMKAGRATGA